MNTYKPVTKLTAMILSLAMTLTLMLGAAPLPEQEDCAHICGDGLCAFDEDAGIDCDHVCGEDCAEIPPVLSDDEPGGESSGQTEEQTDEQPETQPEGNFPDIIITGFGGYEDFFSFDAGEITPQEVLEKLPATLEAVDIDGGEHIITVTWETPDFDPNPAEFTEYIFTARLPQGFALDDDTDPPQVTVCIVVTATPPSRSGFSLLSGTTTGTFNLADGTWNDVLWDTFLEDVINISWNGEILTVNDGANITVTGVTDWRRIEVNGEASITLNNVSITLDENFPAISLSAGANLTLTIEGTNTLTGGSSSEWSGQAAIFAPAGTTLKIDGQGSLTANGGPSSAGIGSGSTGSGGNITISGGTVTAVGGGGGAGIGGGTGSNGDTILISGGTVIATGGNGTGAGIGGGTNGAGGKITISGGTVTATGGSSPDLNHGGAGIGGGTNPDGAGGDITINGGTVTAIGGANSAGIGGGRGATNGGTLAMNDSALVYASSLSNNIGTQTNTDDVESGILFDGDDGTVYGNVTLEDDLTITAGQTLNIPDNATLTVPDGVTLTNEGTINNNGGTINGDVTEIPAPVITTTSLPNGTYNTLYSQTLEATSGNITWSVSDGALPGGLTLNAATGVISGTPTAADTFTFTVKAENVKSSDEVEFTVVIAPAAGSFVSPAALNTTYTPTLTLADVTPATGYAWVTPSTPIPNAGDNQSFPATYTDPSGNSLPATGNITVNVAKAAAPANVNTTRSFPAGTGDTQHVNLPTLLPTVAGSFGNPVSYTAVITDNTLGANLTAPTGTVSSPAAMAIIVASTATAGQSATITVTVTSQNYADFDIVITVNIMDKMPTTVTVTPLADITYGDTLGNPTAVADAGDVGTFTFLYTGTLNMGAGYNPYSSADKPTAPGTYAVRATLISDTHTGAATSAEFTIARKQLTWSNGIVQNKTYDGHTVATIATPPTLIGIINNDTVNVSSGMVLFASANVGTHEITANIFGIANSGDGWKYTVSGQPIFSNASITRANQDTLTVVQPGPLTFGESPITLSTTGGSGDGAVSFTVVSGPGTVSGSTLTITGAGNIVVNATKAGGTNHNATTSANITITVNQARIPTAMIAVTSPVRGNAPNTSAMITGGGGFTAGAVSWSGSPSFFLPETQYTVTVTLAAQQGFTFTGGLATATINGQNATVSNNTGANVTLSYEFPATAAAEAPGAPQSFTATAGNGQVTLSWSAPANNGGSAITKYEVSSDDGATWTDASSGAGHTFTGLTNGTAYTFKVRAVNSVGEGAEATATATPVVPTYSLIVANGTGSGSFTAGTQVTITASAAPLGQVFDSWTGGNGGAFASASSATTTFTMPANAATVTATYRSSGGNNQVGSGGSSSSGSGIIGAITSLFTPANAPQTVTQAAANTATQNAVAAAIAEGSTTATANIKNPGEISVSNLQAMAATASEAGMESIRLQADSMTANNRAVDVRITLDPAQSTQDLNLSASTTNAQATRTTNTFTRFFSNDVMTVSLGQQGDFGQTVTIAARLNPELNTDNLAFYAYDRETNTYKQIREPNYRIDSNGYVHFQTALAGDIVISDGALSRR